MLDDKCVKRESLNMLPLLFILIITGLSILVSSSISPEKTWFSYYIGGMIGLFISGVLLSIWNKRKRFEETKKNRN